MNLDEIREQIDEIDAQILDLFCRRMDLVKTSRNIKSRTVFPCFIREGNRVSSIGRGCAGEAYGDYAAALFQRMMEVSRRMQEKWSKNSRRKKQRAVSQGEDVREAEKSEKAGALGGKDHSH